MNLTCIIYALRYKHTHTAVLKPQYRNWWWPKLKIIKRDKLTTKNHRIAVVALTTSATENLPFIPWKREGQRVSFYPHSFFDIFHWALRKVRAPEQELLTIGANRNASRGFQSYSQNRLEFTAFKQKLKYSQVNCVIFAAFTLNKKTSICEKLRKIASQDPCVKSPWNAL